MAIDNNELFIVKEELKSKINEIIDEIFSDSPYQEVRDENYKVAKEWKDNPDKLRSFLYSLSMLPNKRYHRLS